MNAKLRIWNKRVEKYVLTLFFNYFIGSSTRLLAYLIFFTPCLGLFNTLAHWKLGQIPASSEEFQIYDVEFNNGSYQEVPFKDKWKQLDSYTELSSLSAEQCIAILAVGFGLHFLFIFVIKYFTSLEFSGQPSNIFIRGLDLIGKLFVPRCFKDWDHHYDMDSETFFKTWPSYKLELRCLHLLFLVEHLLLCIPCWLLKANIQTRNEYLEEFFPPLPEEITSTTLVNILSIFCPVFFALSSFLQYNITLLYIKYGHPWAKIFQLEVNQLKVKQEFKVYEEIPMT